MRYTIDVYFTLLYFTLLYSHFNTLAAICYWSGVLPSVRLSVCPAFFQTLTGRAAHTQHASPWASTRRGQRTFSSEYDEDRHSCFVHFCVTML